MKDYMNSSPVYSGKVKILETTDTDHADNFNVPTKQLADNDQCLKNAICKSEKIETFEAGQTTATFNFDEGIITENSRISVETSVPDMDYNNISVDGDSVTVTFEAQENDVYVKVVVSDELV